MTATNTTTTWLTELNQDMDPATGYLVESPTSLYGLRVKELVNYTCSQSSEVKTILNSRRIRTSPCCLYMLEVIRFLADYILPLVVALYSAFSYYSSTQQHPVEPETNRTETVEEEDTWVDNAAFAGGWFGETIRYAISVPVSFLVSTIDGGLHVSQGIDYLQQRTELIIYTPLLFVAVYIVTLVSIRFLLNLYTICSAERALWNYQELVLQETRQVVERAITNIMRPALLAKGKSQDQDLSLCLEHISSAIKGRPLPELLALGNVSTPYTDSLRMLIRHADEDLSTAMFRFTNELHKIEGRLSGSRERPENQLQRRIQPT
jgi:hypothetical protein